MSSDNGGMPRRDLSPQGSADMFQFLADHEDDIALDMNDFGRLRLVFVELFKRQPKAGGTDGS